MTLQDPRYAELVTRLRRRRRSLGLTQRALGLRIGKPQSYVSKYETCERRLDPIEMLDVCGALGTDPIQALEGLTRVWRAPQENLGAEDPSVRTRGTET